MQVWHFEYLEEFNLCYIVHYHLLYIMSWWLSSYHITNLITVGTLLAHCHSKKMKLNPQMKVLSLLNPGYLVSCLISMKRYILFVTFRFVICKSVMFIEGINTFGQSTGVFETRSIWSLRSGWGGQKGTVSEKGFPFWGNYYLFFSKWKLIISDSWTFSGTQNNYCRTLVSGQRCRHCHSRRCNWAAAISQNSGMRLS